ncbi:MAG: hypothetical protein VR68_16650 [Peptococcaceae bacterium BRH_c4a]|nr:MAG: hypothetical protein VR68_16650 [Peptococcaceae bacterium BRH_c4a]
MEDNQFKEYVVSTLAEILKRQEQMQAEIKEVKLDVKRIDKKTDSILKYVEYVDSDLQKHKKAEVL